ncbi:radical SAM protein [bacterium]|nr:radical SAM protein [candidate division CSSED10-310 bacterium]
MARFTCDWIFNILVVLCDGKVVCGCADPYGLRPLGDANKQSLHEIWNSHLAQSIRRDLNGGFSGFCEPCGLKCPVSTTEKIPERPLCIDHMSRLFIEPTVLCNLDCYKSVCNHASGITQTRSKPYMDIELFKRLADEAGPWIQRLDFFNYGESFVHPQAVDMIEYFKERYPNPYLYVSTNGLMLDESKIDRLVKAGIDEITFSVDGSDQATYERYRIGGNFSRVVELMAYTVKARNSHGREVPFINWRYILFNWNDTDDAMNKARELAAAISVDRLTWEITDHPPDARSARFQPGTDSWRAIYNEIWDTSHLSNAIKSNRYMAVISTTGLLPVLLRRGRSGRLRVTARNTASMPWWDRTSSGRRLVRLGAQLHDRRKNLINRDYTRSFLPRTVNGGDDVDIHLDLPPIPKSGLYWLKFDMVSEGIDWFERAGSPVIWRRLVVI